MESRNDGRPRPFPRGPRADRPTGGGADRRGPVRPVDAGRQPGEVAPRAHHLVLRDVRAGPASARLPRVRPHFGYLFNSYYEAVGPAAPAAEARPADPARRPSEVGAYRAHVDAAMRRLLARAAGATARALVELGLQHEQQHQELLLTDILHAFAQNPLLPAVCPGWREPEPARRPDALARLRAGRRASRSATPARASPSTTRRRATTSGCSPIGSPTGW